MTRVLVGSLNPPLPDLIAPELSPDTGFNKGAGLEERLMKARDEEEFRKILQEGAAAADEGVA